MRKLKCLLWLVICSAPALCTAQDTCTPMGPVSKQWLVAELRCTADTYLVQEFRAEHTANKNPGFNKGSFGRNFQAKVVLRFAKYGVVIPAAYVPDQEFVRKLREVADILESK